ncbi:zinc-binding alcohol dehydrogenase family protein [Streptomyces sp. NPDC050564]|uniref:zinc-binding alcohol dehydrogenase family protein n=1 Tax=Streptomyces sp. NPDC050564 TaxID=3365631 RepID=UPI0037ADD766
MKTTAARLVEHGRPLEVTEVDLPAPSADEVEMEMAYGGVNPVDRYRALGKVDAGSPVPRTLGAEGAGLVDGKPFVVFGHGVGATRDGIWATRAVVPRSALIEVPDGVELRHAAVMGVAGVTAWRTVTELGRVTPDDRVLVLGASGGVGSTIVSLVHRLGATVWGQSGDPGNVEWLRAQGADRVVVGDVHDLVERVNELQPSVVFDPLGGGFTGAAIEALAPRGRLVIFGTSAGPTGTVPLQTIYRSALRILGYGGLRDPDNVHRAGLLEALRALAEHRLSVVVGRTLPLSAVNKALELIAERAVRGKIALDLREG